MLTPQGGFRIIDDKKSPLNYIGGTKVGESIFIIMPSNFSKQGWPAKCHAGTAKEWALPPNARAGVMRWPHLEGGPQLKPLEGRTDEGPVPIAPAKSGGERGGGRGGIRVQSRAVHRSKMLCISWLLVLDLHMGNHIHSTNTMNCMNVLAYIYKALGHKEASTYQWHSQVNLSGR